MKAPSIKLHPFTHKDFPSRMAWANNPEILLLWSGIQLAHPLDIPQLENYLNTHGNNPTNRLYTAKLTDGNIPCGHIELRYINQKPGIGRLSYVLVAPHMQGQGIGTQMVRELLRIAFDEFDLKRVDLGAFDFNTKAIAMYEKVGFVKTGLSKKSIQVGNKYLDTIQMSILEHDWSNR